MANNAAGLLAYPTIHSRSGRLTTVLTDRRSTGPQDTKSPNAVTGLLRVSVRALLLHTAIHPAAQPCRVLCRASTLVGSMPPASPPATRPSRTVS
eukprot:6491156-Amphidinium_carterae.2